MTAQHDILLFLADVDGALVTPDLSVIESHTLDPAVAHQAVDLLLGSGLDVWVYTETEWLIRDKNAPHVARESWTVKFDARVVPSFTEAQLAHAVKIVGISDDLDLVAACEKAAQNALGERASAVTDSNEHEGFANAVRKLVLLPARA